MVKKEQSLKIWRHHRIKHTILVLNLLTTGKGIEKSVFFFHVIVIVTMKVSKIRVCRIQANLALINMRVFRKIKMVAGKKWRRRPTLLYVCAPYNYIKFLGFLTRQGVIYNKKKYCPFNKFRQLYLTPTYEVRIYQVITIER